MNDNDLPMEQLKKMSKEDIEIAAGAIRAEDAIKKRLGKDADVKFAGAEVVESEVRFNPRCFKLPTHYIGPSVTKHLIALSGDWARNEMRTRHATKTQMEYALAQCLLEFVYRSPEDIQKEKKLSAEDIALVEKENREMAEFVEQLHTAMFAESRNDPVKEAENK